MGRRSTGHQKKFRKIVNHLKAIAHPIRLRIMDELFLQEQHVTSLVNRLGIKQAIISQQLRILRMNGLVKATREDGYSNYRITHLETRELIQFLRGK